MHPARLHRLCLRRLIAIRASLRQAAKRTEALQRLPKGIKAAKAAKAAGRPSLMPVDRTLQSMQPAKQPAKPAKKPVQKPAAAKRGQPANAYGQLKAVAKTAALKPKPVVKAKPSLKAVIKAKPSRPKAKASSSVVMPKPAVKSKKTVVVVKKSAEKKRRAAGPPAIAKGKLDKTKVVFHRAGISGISGVSKYPTGKGGPSAVKSLKVRARPGRLSVRSSSHSKSVLHGGFVWAHRSQPPKMAVSGLGRRSATATSWPCAARRARRSRSGSPR